MAPLTFIKSVIIELMDLRKISFSFLFLAAFFAMAGFVYAQSQSPNAQLVITWKAADSYIPPTYIGKALPGSASPITASVVAFSNGVQTNLSNVTLYWYLNDTLLGGGLGQQSMTFNLFGATSGFESLRVEASDYPGGVLMGTTDIPITQPVVVIGGLPAGGMFSATSVVLTAIPYFFNVPSSDQLGYQWSVNGQTVSSAENPTQLKVSLNADTRSGAQFNVTLSTINSIDSTSASDQATLTYQPLP